MAVDQESADPAKDNSRPFGVGECSHGVPLKVHCVECAKPYVVELQRRVAELEHELVESRRANARLRIEVEGQRRVATAHANAEPGRGPKPVASETFAKNCLDGCDLPMGHKGRHRKLADADREQPPATAPDEDE